jgi:hypothetical protein
VRIYKPTIVDGEQRFAANIISVQKQLIAFGELLPERGKALKFGTPIHTLLIHLDAADTLFELNDQGNTRGTSDVARVELTPASLRIMFVADRGPWSGRVSLSPQIEIFDRDMHRSQQLRSVLVEMRPTKTQLERIRSLLAGNKLLTTATAARASSTSTRARRSRRASGSRR